MKRPDFTSPGSLRYRFRKARFRHIEALLDEILARKDRAEILDIGGRPDYWRLLDPRFAGRVRITLLNLHADDLATGEGTPAGLEFTGEVGDGRYLSQYPDAAFDLAHSNSVIEHVGTLSDMAQFARETRRVGAAYYVQTPNFWFPIEPHYGVPFFHWLPETMRAALHASVNVGYARKVPYEKALRRVDNTRIVSRRLIRELFPDAHHEVERFGPFAKSLIATRPLATAAAPEPWPHGAERQVGRKDPVSA